MENQEQSPRGKEATRQRIVEAAIAVFAEKGYHDAAVDEIVRASGTSKGAFYFHFPSKEEIFFALIEGRATHQVPPGTGCGLRGYSPHGH